MIHDLLNPALKPMREPRVSILHLPADPPAPHDFQDVPHGTVRLHTYRSKSLGRLRPMRVYTPPDYDRQPDARFPTLFLQHGMGDTQDTWTEHGKAHWILDHLIAAGRAVPMIVVMLDGHAHLGNTGPEGFGRNAVELRRDLIEDALPFFEAKYRARPDADSRAIAGLSMGGGHALTIGLNHPELFRWVGAFSAAIPPDDAIRAWLDNADNADQKLRLLWLAIGRDDFLSEMNHDYHALLQRRGVPHAWHLTDGDHSWPVWRRYLADFAPKLFQPPAE